SIATELSTATATVSAAAESVTLTDYLTSTATELSTSTVRAIVESPTTYYQTAPTTVSASPYVPIATGTVGVGHPPPYRPPSSPIPPVNAAAGKEIGILGAVVAGMVAVLLA